MASTFCRHNRLTANCPICSQSDPALRSPVRRPASTVPARAGGQAQRGGLRIRQAARQADDGYRSELVPGLKLSADAERLAAALARATGRLDVLERDPPGLYAEIAAEPDAEEALWLAFLVAYLSPAEGDDPFASIRAVRTTWAGATLPELGAVTTGPRSAHDPQRGTQTLAAYRSWALRAGSQATAFAGEAQWTARRRFERVFERLALPGLHRAARFDLLVTLGRLGRQELRAGALQLTVEDAAVTAAKRVFGIGAPLLLERRAAGLAQAVDVPLEALDLALYNWGVTDEHRATMGVSGAVANESTTARIRAALGL